MRFPKVQSVTRGPIALMLDRSKMSTSGQDWRPDFEQALGETFGDFLCPPLPLDDASPHECCEVVWQVTGYDVTPAQLRDLTANQIEQLAKRFGEYFECTPPTVFQIKEAISHTLARWPPGSLGEPA